MFIELCGLRINFFCIDVDGIGKKSRGWFVRRWRALGKKSRGWFIRRALKICPTKDKLYYNLRQARKTYRLRGRPYKRFNFIAQKFLSKIKTLEKPSLLVAARKAGVNPNASTASS